MMEMMLGLNLFLVFIVIGLFAIWIWAMIDIITSKFKEDLMQIVWLLVVFFLPFLGVLLYLLIGRTMKRIPPEEQNPADKYDHLAKLKSLLDRGILTPEEYEAEKEKILNRF
ncbi:putative integral membrane protein [Sulfuricurvum kujiense DSM 16994]|uniref:Integral membrane protein n=1 Tax=Sulfuricurvum kujiense (strain ATCC BAA-921 / DSM 16994 / JCM 11577 / YK-1) TaxID=709032 RepID=E4U343_SULKY|nr:SHOCT domain-containing protein [Sulfuricurvum kujiense]ADR33713.1 putative integral membrane protein [Sulfuricurvum kujiense DSM 16994]